MLAPCKGHRRGSRPSRALFAPPEPSARTDGQTIPVRRTGRAVYYRSTNFDGVAHMAACATGDGRVLRGRFDDNGIAGTLVERLVARDRFVATLHGDGHTPFRVVATRVNGG